MLSRCFLTGAAALLLALTTRGSTAAAPTLDPMPASGPAAVPAAVSTAVTATGTTPPNVVVVVIDDMGFEDLFFVPTPNMLALAAQGQLCTNFYVHPVCSPSRIGLHFGTYAIRDGIGGALNTHASSNGVPAERLSLAQVLHAEGYATALFGKWHVSTKADGSAHEHVRRFGFEHWFEGVAGNIGKEGQATQIGWRPINDGYELPVAHYTGDLITDTFEAWWSQPATRPRFASINYTTPHEPWTTPPAQFLPPGYVHGTNKRERFEASVAALDGFLGRVMAAVDLATTYLVVLPDNGTPHNTKPPSHWYKGYKLSPWQGGVHVPLLIAGPGIAPGLDAHLAHVIDLPETILELCGFTAPTGFEDGESFAPSLFGPMPPRAPVLMQYRKVDEATGLVTVDDWAVVDANGMKLVSESNVKTLYRLSADPFETTPLWLPQIQVSLQAVKDAIDP